MKTSLARTGIVLYTLIYAECVVFYRDVVGLPMQFKTDEVTCLAFGSAYLMIEPGAGHDRPANERTCLRLNVTNIRARADALIARGVDVDYQEHDWGTVAKFRDPDGNLCALKDDESFEQQIVDGAARARA